MNLPSSFDTVPDTYCLSLNECIYGQRGVSRVVFKLKREVYMQVDFTKLMPDKCIIVPDKCVIVNNVFGVPAMQSTDNTIDHGFWFLWIVPLALRISPSSSHSIVALFLIVYVYHNALCYYCDELLDSIEVSNT